MEARYGVPRSLLVKGSPSQQEPTTLAPPNADGQNGGAERLGAPREPKRRWTGWKWLASAAALAAALWFGAPRYWRWRESRVFPAGLIQVNGRIEGDRYTLSSKHGGRITDLAVAEGDPVQRGQVVARLDDAQLREQLRQAEAALQEARAEERGAGENVALTEETGGAQVQQAQGALAQAESAVGGARAEVSRASASLESSRAEVGTAAARIETARSAETAAGANRDTAEEEIRAAEAAREAALAARRRAQETVSTAQAQVESARANVAAMRERVAGAEAGYEKARTDARRYRMLFNEGAAAPRPATPTTPRRRRPWRS